MPLEDLTYENLRAELEMRTSRSGGSGGQHVNKTETRVTLRWNLKKSKLLNDEQKELLESRISGKLHSDGTLQVSSGAERSQSANRETAERRLMQIIQKGLMPEKKRKESRKPLSATKERLESKRIQGEKKAVRSRKFPTDSD